MAFNNVDANWINQVVEMSKRKNPLLGAAGEPGTMKALTSSKAAICARKCSSR